MTDTGNAGATTGENTDEVRPAGAPPQPRRASSAKPLHAAASVVAGLAAGLLFLPVVPIERILPWTTASAGRPIGGRRIASGILPRPDQPRTGLSASGHGPDPAFKAQHWVLPVPGLISSGFRDRIRPNHNGVDLAAPRGSLIHAASDGTVTTVRCEVTPADRGCDVDGSLSVLGCGWYVDIEHVDGIVTRYCHQLVHPFVQAGQRVTAGQVIGRVGTSGNSSGPHLHFEVHLGDGTPATATDPVSFLAQRGVRLG